MAASNRTNKSNNTSGKKSQGNSKNTANKSSTGKTKTVKTSAANAKQIELDEVMNEKREMSERDKKIRNEITLLVASAITLILLLSNFGLMSSFGYYVSYFMFGLVGFTAYVLPVILFFGIAFLLSNLDNIRGKVKFVSGVALYMLISSLIQLVFMDNDKTKSAFDYYAICGKEKIGGGFIGALIQKMLTSIFGILGTYIILLLLVIISLVIITEKSFISGVKKGSAVVYESAVEDATRLKKSADKRKREREYLRKEKRRDKVIRGVNISKVGDSEDIEDEDIHEIHQSNMKHIKGENTYVYQGHVHMDDEPFSYNEPVDESIDDEYEDTYGDTYGDTYEDTYEDMNEEHHKAAYVEQHESERSEQHAETYENTYVEPTMEEVHEVFSDEELHTDEDGMFRPKEKIEVSKEAKAIMNRKPFEGSVILKPANEASVHSDRPGMQTSSQPKQSSLTTSNTTSAGVGTIKQAPKRTKPKNYVLPSTDLLDKPTGSNNNYNVSALKQVADRLEEILKTFGVNAKVVDFSRGPSVTRYEIQPETGTRLSKITSLADDIKLNMAVTDIRIEPIPGKPNIGIEVSNETRDSVLIRELIESKELRSNTSKIAFAAGKDIAGKVIVGDIAKMPHLLVAGTTGSGKSVFTNSIIMNILFRAKPTEVRLIVVDPKVVEFGIYNGIPHLLQPVVTDPKLANNTLKWAVAEMSDRYKKFADFNVRDLKGYNEKIDTMPKDAGLSKLPQIVIVIDELADLMMAAAKEVEESICRLAQLARAAGIHLIIATQRPSVDVVTGLIKANIPSRNALKVASGVDSRTIIDTTGADKLLGNGDMLFYPSGFLKPVRLQGSYVSDNEVQRVVDFWKAQADGSEYDESISSYVAPTNTATASGSGDGLDDYFYEAAKFVIEREKASTSMLQRMFKIGFNRAARIMDQLCEAGVVGEEEGTKPRRVLMTLDDLEMIKNQ